jgi:hypothetical protein
MFNVTLIYINNDGVTVAIEPIKRCTLTLAPFAAVLKVRLLVGSFTACGEGCGDQRGEREVESEQEGGAGEG